MCADMNIFEDVKKFVIHNLKNFKTDDADNVDFIKMTIEAINIIKNNNTNEIRNILLDYESKISNCSRGIKTLYFILRKQIENWEYYKRMGVNNIIPGENPIHINKYDMLLAQFNFNLQDFIDSISGSTNNKYPGITDTSNYNDWIKDLAIVCVSGNIKSHGNVFGHALLRLGDLGYLHINNLISKPKFIPHFKFYEYLNKNNVFVVDVQRMPQNLKPEIVKEAIKTYSSKRWDWRIVHHNCLSFAREAARKCGVPDSHLGGGHGNIKTPIEFFMLLDKDKRESKAELNSSPGFWRKHLITNPLDDAKAVTTALHQKYWSNIVKPDNDIPKIERNNPGIAFFSEKRNMSSYAQTSAKPQSTLQQPLTSDSELNVQKCRLK